MGTKENEKQLVEILKNWQHVENQSVAQTAGIIDQTSNPVIQMIMSIIQRDSAMHHRVQQFIVDSLETRALSVTPEDLAQVWEAIEAHIEAEKQTESLIAAAQKALAGTKNVVQAYLLSYLEHDEKKHDKMLDDLALIKRGMYKSA
jgi:restriction endonuclease Mrr